MTIADETDWPVIDFPATMARAGAYHMGGLSLQASLAMAAMDATADDDSDA